jgi:hypothetical protein
MYRDFLLLSSVGNFRLQGILFYTALTELGVYEVAYITFQFCFSFVAIIIIINALNIHATSWEFTIFRKRRWLNIHTYIYISLIQHSSIDG